MNIEDLALFLGLHRGKDYENIKAKDFEENVFIALSRHGEVKRQVIVPNRYDGRRGKIDFVINFKGQQIPIEIDRQRPRKKSLFKIEHYPSDYGFCILRSPFEIIKVIHKSDCIIR